MLEDIKEEILFQANSIKFTPFINLISYKKNIYGDAFQKHVEYLNELEPISFLTIPYFILDDDLFIIDTNNSSFTEQELIDIAYNYIKNHFKNKHFVLENNTIKQFHTQIYYNYHTKIIGLPIKKKTYIYYNIENKTAYYIENDNVVREYNINTKDFTDIINLNEKYNINLTVNFNKTENKLYFTVNISNRFIFKVIIDTISYKQKTEVRYYVAFDFEFYLKFLSKLILLKSI